MIIKRLNHDYFTVGTDRRSMLIEALPEIKESPKASKYAYVTEKNFVVTAREFVAENDVEALIKAERKMIKEGDEGVWVGRYLGKDEDKRKIFQDICLLTSSSELDEEISDGLSSEIATQSVRLGLKYLSAKTVAQKQNIQTALNLLTTAASVVKDAHSRKLLNLAKRVSNDDFERSEPQKKEEVHGHADRRNT